MFSQKGEKLHTRPVHRHVSKQQTKRMTSIRLAYFSLRCVVDPDPDPEMEFVDGFFSLGFSPELNREPWTALLV